MSRLALLVFRAQQALSSDGDRLTARWKMTSAQWKVLGAVALSERALSAAAIGRAMGLTRQAATKQIQLLLGQGLLKQQADPTDARAPVHSLTPRGRAAYEAITAAWARRVAAISSGLRQADFEVACALLEGLVDRLERVPAAAEPSGRRPQTKRREARR